MLAAAALREEEGLALMLPPEEPWLDPDITAPVLLHLLHAFWQPDLAAAMQAVPVSPAVNTVNVNNGPVLHARVPPLVAPSAPSGHGDPGSRLAFG
jgi:hypothetical protein